MSEITSLTFQSVRFNPLFPAFKKACEQFNEYQFSVHPQYSKIRRKDDHNAKYTLQVEEGETGLVGRCACKAFVTQRESVCKHIFIRAFKMLNMHVKDVAVHTWSELLKQVVINDIEAILQIPKMNTTQLRVIHEALTGKEPEETPVVQSVSTSDMFKDPDNELDMSNTTFEQRKIPIVKQELEEDDDEFEETPKPVIVKQTKALAKPTKAFGGTVADIPKNLVVLLGGKPYVTKAGLIFAASQMGLSNIKTEPIHWSWTNKAKRAVFQATVTFDDGRSFTAYGVAIPDGKNVKMEQMFPFVDHLAETRAVGRALRNALAIREPAVEEMPEYKEKYQ